VRGLDMRSQQLDLLFGNADGPLSLSDLSLGIRRTGFDIDTTTSLAVWLAPLTLWQIPVFVYFLPIVGLMMYSGLVSAHKRVRRKAFLRHE
jgi:hypothetical protein